MIRFHAAEARKFARKPALAAETLTWVSPAAPSLKHCREIVIAPGSVR